MVCREVGIGDDGEPNLYGIADCMVVGVVD